jgi:hypothetical protein
MVIRKIYHKNESRILLDLPYSGANTEKVKQLLNSKWSQTYKGWHIAYNNEAFNVLKTHFPDLQYEAKQPPNEPGLTIVTTFSLSTSPVETSTSIAILSPFHLPVCLSIL